MRGGAVPEARRFSRGAHRRLIPERERLCRGAHLRPLVHHLAVRDSAERAHHDRQQGERTERGWSSAEPHARVGRLDGPLDGIEQIGTDGIEINLVA